MLVLVITILVAVLTALFGELWEHASQAEQSNLWILLEEDSINKHQNHVHLLHDALFLFLC